MTHTIKNMDLLTYHMLKVEDLFNMVLRRKGKQVMLGCILDMITVAVAACKDPLDVRLVNAIAYASQWNESQECNHVAFNSIVVDLEAAASEYEEVLVVSQGSRVTTKSERELSLYASVGYVLDVISKSDFDKPYEVEPEWHYAITRAAESINTEGKRSETVQAFLLPALGITLDTGEDEKEKTEQRKVEKEFLTYMYGSWTLVLIMAAFMLITYNGAFIPPLSCPDITAKPPFEDVDPND